jgi:flagella basal body P-ring formation protein FlgA
MSAIARAILLTVLWLVLPAVGHAEPPAASLRLQVRVDGGVIRLADLWDNAGAKANTVIGAAPPPGRSIAIETAQLAYIAHLYDVNWKPVSGVERSSIERAGRPLTRDEMVEPIRRSLVEAGTAPTVTIELASFAPILVPPASFPLLQVEAMAYDAGSARFSADLIVSTEGMQTQRVRVAGRAIDMVTAVVAARRLEPGDVIAATDLRTVQVAERRLAGAAASDVSQVLGQTPKHTIVAGQPLMIADVGAPVMVSKGATVVIVLETPNMSLAAQGLALSSGGRDDVIQIMNPVSRAVVAARVSGPGKAIILPGATPLIAPAHSMPRNSEVAN